MMRWQKVLMGLALSLAALAAGAADEEPMAKRLEATALLPAPVFDSGGHVPGRDWALSDGRAETFRNIAEVLPTRRIAPAAHPFALRAPAGPFPFHYAYGGATYSVEDFARRTDTTALLILKDDRIIYERYYGDADAQDTFQSFSAGKSFVSTLVGFARAEGLIHSLEDPVSRYLPEVAGSAYASARIVDVLRMASGTSYIEEYEDPTSDIAEFARITDVGAGGLYDFARSFRAVRPAGTKFYYASTDTEILGALVARVTGKSLSAYLSEKLWVPMGAEAPARWALDARGSAGREIAAGALQVTLRDYGRFGYLFAHDGVMAGQRILPTGWVAEATVPSAPYVQYGQLEPGDPTGYGYQWWCFPDEHRAFSAEGIHGQFVYVDPVTHVVVVKLSAWSHAWDDAKAEESAAFFEAVSSELR